MLIAMRQCADHINKVQIYQLNNYVQLHWRIILKANTSILLQWGGQEKEETTCSCFETTRSKGLTAKPCGMKSYFS
jgi:hypothetical protein